jgi:hypothetical protein
MGCRVEIQGRNATADRKLEYVSMVTAAAGQEARAQTAGAS